MNPGEVGVTIIRSHAPETIAVAYRKLSSSVTYFARFPILSFDLLEIALFHTLRKMRLNVGSMDLRIAAIALEANCTVITRNLRDFRRVPGLTVEDWSA